MERSEPRPSRGNDGRVEARRAALDLLAVCTRLYASRSTLVCQERPFLQPRPFKLFPRVDSFDDTRYPRVIERSNLSNRQIFPAVFANNILVTRLTVSVTTKDVAVKFAIYRQPETYFTFYGCNLLDIENARTSFE